MWEIREVRDESLLDTHTSVSWSLGFESVAIALSTTVGANSWCSGSLRIAFAPQVERATVAHELGHAVAFQRAAGSAGHGSPWRGWFVTVVEILHGSEAADGLAAAFATYGLPVTPTGVEWLGQPLVGMGV